MIQVGKDGCPLTIQSLASATAPTFMKQAGFKALVQTLKSNLTREQYVELLTAEDKDALKKVMTTILIFTTTILGKLGLALDILYSFMSKVATNLTLLLIPI